MSNARKLQTEIDRVTKKVDEGVELFDEIWEKVYSAESQNQKEKHEIDLKKEIKKLQRLRDQIKTWIGSSDVKDKDSLIDYRKLIETKMEQFKVCEKETKTKTYSKEGLARAEKLSPEEQAKIDTCKWVGETIEQIQQLVEEKDVEIERLSTGKGKKTNKHVIEEYNEIITSHKFHINKLEGIMRLVMNDRLDSNLVDDMKDDIDYYVEANEEEEYMQCYDEEMFYDDLRLDELGVVDVDRVTHAHSIASETKRSKSGDDNSTHSGSHKDKPKSKKAASSNVVPLTIGRARVSSKNMSSSQSHSSSDGKDVSTPTKKASSNQPSITPGPTPTARAAPPNVVNGGVGGGQSMAAILKREGEAREEKERQKQAAILQQQQQRLIQEQARAQAEQLRVQQLQRQQEALRQQEVLRQQQQQQVAAQVALQKSQQEALQRQQQQQHHQQKLQEQARQQQEASAIKQQQQQQQLQAHQQQQQQSRTQPTPPPPGTATGNNNPSSSSSQNNNPIDSLLTGLGGLPLGSTSPTPVHSSPSAATVSPQQGGAPAQNANSGTATTTSNDANSNNTVVGQVSIPNQQQPQPNNPTTGATTTSAANYDATASYLNALDESFLHCPSNADSERTRSYTPRNPYPTPSSYPTTPSPIFENPGVFEKLGTDCLFFIFYYAQGTYQQYLTARELKKRSWRYHKKYMTWFQRHEEPKVTTEEYEQGTYVYFDYETGWCQRIKSDFRFEYCFLEDSLSI